MNCGTAHEKLTKMMWMYLVNQIVIATREGGKKQSHGRCSDPQRCKCLRQSFTRVSAQSVTGGVIDLLWTTSGHFWAKSSEHPFCGKSQVRLDPRANARREAWGNLGTRGGVVNDWPDQDGLNFPCLLGYWKHAFYF